MRRRLILLSLCAALCACERPAPPAPAPVAAPKAVAPVLSAQQLRDKAGQCDRVAQEEFRRAARERSAAGGFTNHYSVKLDTCFYLLRTSSDGAVRNQLYDIGTHELYGEFLERTEGRPTTCRVEALHCGSEHEWEVLVRPYMEE